MSTLSPPAYKSLMAACASGIQSTLYSILGLPPSLGHSGCTVCPFSTFSTEATGFQNWAHLVS